MGLFDYFARKRVERLNKLKAELKAEVLEDLRTEFEKDIKGARKFFGEVRDGFSKSVNDAKSGLEERVDAFAESVNSRVEGVERKTEEQFNMTRDAAARAKKAEEAASAAKSSADEAAKRADKSADLVKISEEAYKKIDERAKKVFDDISSKAGLLLANRSEELKDFVDGVLTTSRDVMVEYYKSEYDKLVAELKDEKTKMLDGYHRRMEILERKESAIASVEQRIFDMFKFMNENLPHFAYVVCLPRAEQQLLRDLGKKYNSHADRMMKDLETKAAETRAKKSLSFDELFVVQAPASLKRLVDYQKEHGVQLAPVIAKIDSWRYARPA